VALFKQFMREEILEGLHREVASGRPIVGAGAGIGITAKFAEIGGADLERAIQSETEAFKSKSLKRGRN
jgi:predicted TIM-barrel enzyme